MLTCFWGLERATRDPKRIKKTFSLHLGWKGERVKGSWGERVLGGRVLGLWGILRRGELIIYSSIWRGKAFISILLVWFQILKTACRFPVVVRSLQQIQGSLEAFLPDQNRNEPARRFSPVPTNLIEPVSRFAPVRFRSVRFNRFRFVSWASWCFPIL